jgi:hypothetical protein
MAAMSSPGIVCQISPLTELGHKQEEHDCGRHERNDTATEALGEKILISDFGIGVQGLELAPKALLCAIAVGQHGAAGHEASPAARAPYTTSRLAGCCCHHYPA